MHPNQYFLFMAGVPVQSLLDLVQCFPYMPRKRWRIVISQYFKLRTRTYRGLLCHLLSRKCTCRPMRPLWNTSQQRAWWIQKRLVWWDSAGPVGTLNTRCRIPGFRTRQQLVQTILMEAIFGHHFFGAMNLREIWVPLRTVMVSRCGLNGLPHLTQTK